MFPVMNAGRLIVFGLCAGPRFHVNWAMADTRTSTNPATLVFSRGSAAHAATTPILPAGAQGQIALEGTAGPLENSRVNRSCLNGDGSDAEGGRVHSGCGERQEDDRASTSDAAVDLGELADRVADALVGTNGRVEDGEMVEMGQAASLPAPGLPCQTTDTQCVQEHADSSRRNVEAQLPLLSNADGELNAPPTDDDFNAAGMADNEEVESLEVIALKAAAASGISAQTGVGKACGEGHFRKTCILGEECCNNSCGTCAPSGQSCLQIECEKLTRGNGSSKVDLILRRGPFLRQNLLRPPQIAHAPFIENSS